MLLLWPVLAENLQTNTGKMDPFESALILCSVMTQPLNITRNHDQMSVSSSSCEHHRSVFHKSQDPEVVQKGGLGRYFFQVLLAGTPRKSPGLAISAPPAQPQ